MSEELALLDDAALLAARPAPAGPLRRLAARGLLLGGLVLATAVWLGALPWQAWIPAAALAVLAGPLSLALDPRRAWRAEVRRRYAPGPEQALEEARRLGEERGPARVLVLRQDSLPGGGSRTLRLVLQSAPARGRLIVTRVAPRWEASLPGSLVRQERELDAREAEELAGLELGPLPQEPGLDGLRLTLVELAPGRDEPRVEAGRAAAAPSPAEPLGRLLALGEAGATA